MADRAGQQVGNYRLERLLGAGGFAEVYLGMHIHLYTNAAVKLLHASLASGAEIEQFRTEARTVASLVHPYIVRVLEFGIEAKLPYLVLDYAPGGSLRKRHPSGEQVPLATVVAYVQQIAQALQHAHDQRVIHRDLKPENLLLGRSDELLLTDFGISVVTENTNRQSTKEFAGTVAYSAPEQLLGKPQRASDQYALGVMVYEWLSGQRPFRGAPMEVAFQHAQTSPPPLRERIPTLPPAVEQVVLIALSKDSRERFGSVQAFARALEQAAKAEAASWHLPTVSSPNPTYLNLPSSPLPSYDYKRAAPASKKRGGSFLTRNPTLLTSFILGVVAFALGIVSLIIQGGQPASMGLVIFLVLVYGGMLLLVTAWIGTMVKQAKQKEMYWFLATLLGGLFLSLIPGFICALVYIFTHSEKKLQSSGVPGQPQHPVTP